MLSRPWEIQVRTSRFREADEPSAIPSTIRVSHSSLWNPTRLFPSDSEYPASDISYHTMARARKRSASPADPDDTARPSRKSARRLGARSCEGCHNRKVRCDHGVPCTNCSRHGITCVYPTRNPDATRKTSTLRDISNCLKQLEMLLSRFADSGGAATQSVVNGVGAESQSPSKARPHTDDNVTETTGRHSFDKHPEKSTWEMLLNNSDIQPLLQDVSLDFLSRLFGLSSLFVETIHIQTKLMYGAPSRNPLA